MGAQEIGMPTKGQNRNHWVSGKGDLTGKLAILRGFFRHLTTQKNRNFCCRCDWITFERRILYKSVSEFDVFILF